MDLAMSRRSLWLRRLALALVFLILGPPAGSLAFLAASSLVSQHVPLIDASMLILNVPIAYAYGAGPALFAGAGYTLAPPLARRLVLSPAFGAAAVVVYYAVTGRALELLASRDGGEMLLTMAGVGAAAALICAMIGRAAELDGGARVND